MTTFISAFFYGLGATIGFVSAACITMILFFIVSLFIEHND